MSHSQMLSVELPDASGKTVTFYTYDGYLEENDRSKIHKETQKVNRTTVTGGAIFGLASFAFTRRMPLPAVSLRGFKLPIAGLFSGIVGGIVGYELFSLYASSRIATIKREIVLSSKHLPLWSNLRCAVNPDRAFFELADDRHNEPLLFHAGLSPEVAAKMIPDKIIGGAPHHKPHLSAHSTGHH